MGRGRRSWRWRRPLVVGFVLVLAGLGETGAASSSELPEDAPLLFVIRGRARATNGKLSISTKRIEWFTDRPERRAGSTGAAALVERWAEFGFEDTAPNGALAGKEIDAVVELSDPVVRKGVIHFATTAIRGTVPRGSLGDVSLFVDATTVGTDCAKVQAWSPGIYVDSPGPQFPDAQLQRCDLTGRLLRAGNFAGADMYTMQFSYGDFSYSDLSGADLTNAYMYMAVLQHVNLSDTDMTALNLTQADLTGANLTGVKNIEKAVWYDTTCPDGSITGPNVPCQP